VGGQDAVRSQDANGFEGKRILKTLVFCTAYTENVGEWDRRYTRWVRAVAQSGLAYDQILIVDDGSAALPGWSNVDFMTENGGMPIVEQTNRDRPIFYHFKERWGRADVWDFPGWHRSFAFAAAFAHANGFDKVIHLESDAYLISPRIVTYFNSVTEGWIPLFSPKYDFPELAIQVIAGTQVKAFHDWSRQSYDLLRNRCHETAMPYTKVERGFTGERYGEHILFIPADADYSAQVQIGREPSYYWWMDRKTGSDTKRTPQPSAPKMPEERYLLDFRTTGIANDHCIGDGWSHPEPDLRWMIGDCSQLALPLFPSSKAALFNIRLMPHVWKDTLPQQRVTIYFNKVQVAALHLKSEEVVSFPVPAELFLRVGRNVLEFFHPDATSPEQVSSTGDNRKLAIGIVTLGIQFKERNT